MKTDHPLNQLDTIIPLPTGATVRGALQLPVRALICDIYGTLLISASGDIDCAQPSPTCRTRLIQVLARYGIEMEPPEIFDTLRRTIASEHESQRAGGNQYPEVVIDKIWQSLFFPESPSKAKAFALEYEICVNPVWPMPGARHLLASARADKITLGIVSNAQFYTIMMMEYLLGQSMRDLGFDPCLSLFSFKEGVAKPSPRMFATAADRLQRKGIAPQQALYIGNDVRNDIVPAQSVGFQTVLFAGDKRSYRPRSGDAGGTDVKPNLTISHLDQLTERICS